jgi:hypothetical protein
MGMSSLGNGKVFIPAWADVESVNTDWLEKTYSLILLIRSTTTNLSDPTVNKHACLKLSHTPVVFFRDQVLKAL